MLNVAPYLTPIFGTELVEATVQSTLAEFHRANPNVCFRSPAEDIPDARVIRNSVYLIARNSDERPRFTSRDEARASRSYLVHEIEADLEIRGDIQFHGTYREAAELIVTAMLSI